MQKFKLVNESRPPITLTFAAYGKFPRTVLLPGHYVTLEDPTPKELDYYRQTSLLGARIYSLPPEVKQPPKSEPAKEDIKVTEMSGETAGEVTINGADLAEEPDHTGNVEVVRGGVPDLEVMSKKEIVNYAESIGLELKTTMTKPQLIEAVHKELGK